MALVKANATCGNRQPHSHHSPTIQMSDFHVLQAVITQKLNHSKKLDFAATYNTLKKIHPALDLDPHMMKRCSRMLYRISLKSSPDLTYISAWIGHRLGVALSTHEARSLVVFVKLAAADTESMMEYGYVDLTPPKRSKYKQWCANLNYLADRKLSEITIPDLEVSLPSIHRQKSIPSPLKRKPSHRRSSHSGAVGGGSGEEGNFPGISNKTNIIGMADVVEDFMHIENRQKRAHELQSNCIKNEVYRDLGIYS